MTKAQGTVSFSTGAKARRAARKSGAKSLTKTQKAEVKKLVLQPAETKYVAEFAQAFNGGGQILGFSVAPNIISGGTSSSAWSLIPRLPQSTVAASASTRVGNKISNATLKVDFQFWLEAARAAAATADLTVKLFIVKAKRIKSNVQVTTLPTGGLLDVGDGTNIDWVNTSAVNDKSLALYPLNKELFTVCKIKTFRLAVNQGGQTGDPTLGNAPLMPAHQQMDFSYTMKHPGALLYPDTTIGTQVPENVNLFCFAVVYDTNAYGTVPTAGLVKATCRTHMWFKDM